LCPVECLRFHRPAKFNFARALTHHPRDRGLSVRGGFFVLLIVVPTPKNAFVSARPSRPECHISAVVLAPYRESPRTVVSTTGRVAARGSRIGRCLVSIKRGSRGCGEQLWLGFGRGACRRCQWLGRARSPCLSRVCSGCIGSIGGLDAGRGLCKGPCLDWHGELQQAQCVSQFSGEDRVPPNGHTQSVRLAPPVPQTKTPETLCATRYDDPRFVWTSLTTTH
jgi:hypothetical protein